MLKKVALFISISIIIISCAWLGYSHYFRPVIFAKSVSDFDIPVNSNICGGLKQDDLILMTQKRL